MNSINIDQVADFLLTNQYMLTGLELYQESIERGQDPIKLKNIFNLSKLEESINSEDKIIWENASSIIKQPRGNLNKPSVGTISELSEKISILEYELRQERQTIQLLRKELGSLIKEKEPIASNTVIDASVYRVKQPASHFESRIVNFIIKKYLISQGYKYTALSLSSEVWINIL